MSYSFRTLVYRVYWTCVISSTNRQRSQIARQLLFAQSIIANIVKLHLIEKERDRKKIAHTIDHTTVFTPNVKLEKWQSNTNNSSPTRFSASTNAFDKNSRSLYRTRQRSFRCLFSITGTANKNVRGILFLTKLYRQAHFYGRLIVAIRFFVTIMTLKPLRLIFRYWRVSIN